MTARPRKTTHEQLFWAKTERVDSGCIEWTACRNRQGYGIFIKGLAHRWVWEHTTGVELVPGELILHSCDNPPCINIEHLRVGTAKENTADMYNRNRAPNTGPLGELNAMSRIVASQVVDIRRRFWSGEATLRQLAHEFGYTRTGMSGVIYGLTWKHIPMPRNADAKVVA